jgi:hypothetical protein
MDRVSMSAAVTKDADPHRMLTDDERHILKQGADELRARARLAMTHADLLENSRTVGDALAAEMSWTNRLAQLDDEERM